MRLVVVFALVVGAACTPVAQDTEVAPTALQPEPEKTEPEIKFDVDRDLEDKKASYLTKVPCSFCNESIAALLEICKVSDGRSTDHINDFMLRCTEIGGLQPNKLDLMMSECSDSKMEQSKVNYVYQRRLRCSRIYRSLLQMYAPYDPCLQVRTDFQTNPMTVCQSAWIDCVSNPYGTDDMFKLSDGPKVEFHTPPLTCGRYLDDAVKACTDMKKYDFYAKSNLKGWCSQKYSGKFQALGCETVVTRLTERDMFMDICNGMKLWPVDNTARHCEETLKLTADRPVPVKEYREYMTYIRNVNRDPEYKVMLNSTDVENYPRDTVLYIP